MVEVLEILKSIGNTSSRNDKEYILQQNKDNQQLRDILYFLYNPYIVTGLSAKKINKKLQWNHGERLLSFNEVIEYLKTNNTGRDVDISKIQDFLSFIEKVEDKESRDIYEQIITKSLKIGITDKTINKVFGKNFIPSFNVMLAEKYFECEDKVTGEFIVTQKLDGIRCVIIKENGSIKVFSRQGQPIEDLVEITEEAKNLPGNMVYDGELLLKNDKNLASKDLYRETVKVARKDGIKKNLIFNCFDILPVDEFKDGKSKLKCSFRKAILHEILSNSDFEHIIEVPVLHQGTDRSMIVKLLDEAIAQDQEGVMVNIANAPYECKRTKGILKVKKMNDCDLKVIGFEEGEGKNTGTLGRINVEYKGNIVGVGSGFSDVMRKEVWDNKDKYFGKIAKIQYFEETTNSKDHKVSLRFPVFIEWREDGKEVSYY